MEAVGLGQKSRLESAIKRAYTWPEGKRFAFSIFDDTDSATYENVGGVYRFLGDCGFRTTKSCWVFRGDRNKGRYPGDTLDDERYRRFLLELESIGFLVGWHGATWHGSTRDVTIRALDRFADVFGHYPKSASNHSDDEAVYWGYHRLSGWRSLMYNMATHFTNVGRFNGHVEGSNYFWGDVCSQKIKYYRNFVFRELNTLKACPLMPYHDPQRPYVNYWFASADGSRINQFNRCLNEAAQDRLEEEGGACIIYTHLAHGFSDGGWVEPQFKMLMERLAKKNGWFVPVSTLLDHLLAARGHCDITDEERRRLETKWLMQKFLIGTN
jgi:hypothetical protein